MKVYVVTGRGYVEGVYTNKEVAEKKAKELTYCAGCEGSNTTYCAIEKELIEGEGAEDTMKAWILADLEKLAETGDLWYEVDEDGDIIVTVEDFEGFDEDYHEVYNEYDKRIDTFISNLDINADEIEGDLYTYYQFYEEGFTVQLGFTSFDI